MQSFHACIRHYSPRRQGGSRRTVLAHITGISPLRGSLRAAPIAWSRYHPGLWLDRSIITRLLTRVGLGKPAAMRNSPPQAVFWTDGHRSAPSLAVFDTELYPAQVVLAHPPASLQPPFRRASRQRTYPAAGYEVFKLYRRYKTSYAWGASRTEAKTRAHEVFAHVGRPGSRAFDFMAVPLKAAHGQICYARA